MLKSLIDSIVGKPLKSPNPSSTHIRDYQREEVKLSNGNWVLHESWFDVHKSTRIFLSTPLTK